MKAAFSLKIIFLTLIISCSSGKELTDLYDFTKIANHYMEAEYDACFYRAYKKTRKKSTRKNPLPYLWCSMCAYEMGLRPEEYAEEFPKAFRDALKYAIKYRKKDKEDEYWKDNKRFFDDLKKEAYEVAEMYLDEENYRKANYYYKGVTRYYPEDFASKFMKGYTLVMNRQRSTGQKEIAATWEEMEDIDDISGYEEESQRLFKLFLTRYSTYLMDEGLTSDAQETMEKGKKYFEDDEEFISSYEYILN